MILSVLMLLASAPAGARSDPGRTSVSEFAAAQEPRLSDVLGRWEMTFATAEGLDAPGEIEIRPPFDYDASAAQVYAKGLDPRGNTLATVTRQGGPPGVRGFREGSFQFALASLFAPYEYLFRCRVPKTGRLLCQVASVVVLQEKNWSAETARWYMGFRRIKGPDAAPAQAPSAGPRRRGEQGIRLWNEGVLLLNKGDREGARKAWEECARVDPSNADCASGIESLRPR